MRKTKPIHPARPEMDAAGQGRRRPGHQLCETNPIPAKRTQFPAVPSGRAPGVWDAGANAQNKPNFGRCDRRAPHYSSIPSFQSDADRAKQSQSPAGPGGRERVIMQNKPNLPGGAGRPSPAHRPSGLAPPPEAVVQNEPNLRRAKCPTGHSAAVAGAQIEVMGLGNRAAAHHTGTRKGPRRSRSLSKGKCRNNEGNVT